MDETGLLPGGEDMQKRKSNGGEERSNDRGINAGNRGHSRRAVVQISEDRQVEGKGFQLKKKRAEEEGKDWSNNEIEGRCG